MEENNKQKKQEKDALWKRILKISGRIFIGIVVFLLLLMLLVQLPFVQNYITEKSSEYLEERLNTEVSIDGFSLNFFDDFELNGVLIKDYDNDTLLYAGSVGANFKKPLITVIQRKLFLEGVTLKNAHFHMKRGPDDEDYNIVKILQNFTKEDTANTTQDTASSAFNLSLDYLELENIHFTQNDSLYGSKLDISLGDGWVGVKELRTKSQVFNLGEINLNNASVLIEKFAGEKEFVDTSQAGNLPFVVNANSLNVSGSKFKLNDTEQPHSASKGIDFRHLDVFDIDIAASDISFNNWVTKASPEKLNFSTNDGFSLKQFDADSVYVSPEKTRIYKGELVSQRSNINLDLLFEYDEFGAYKDFVDRINMNIMSDRSSINVEDVMKFAPALYDVPFFVDNKNKEIQFDGRVEGNVNNLNSENLYLTINNTKVDGDILIRDIASDKEPYMNLDLNKLTTTMEEVRSFLPGAEIDEKLMRLNKIDFTGEYEGSFRDFIANGTLNTSLGTAVLDIDMNLEKGSEQADYLGDILLEEFQLGKFTGDEKLGVVSLEASLEPSKGLTLETVDANFDATIQKFEYSGYMYRDIDIKGNIKDNLFSGQLDIEDQYIDLNLNGDINFSDINHPSFDAKLIVDKADLEGLNLTDYPMNMEFKFSGDVDSFDIYNFRGDALVRDLRITKMDSIEMTMDSLEVISSTSGGQNVLQINSELLNGEIIGDYSLFNSVSAIKNLFARSYPAFAEQLNIQNDTASYNAQLDLELKLHNSANFEKLISPDLSVIKDLKIQSYIDSKNDTIYFSAFAPDIEYQNNQLLNSYIFLESIGNEGNLVLSVDSTIVGNTRLKPISVFSDIVKDTIQYNVNVSDFDKVADNLNISGKLFTKDSLLVTSILNTDFTLFNEQWNIDPENKLFYSDDYLNIRDFIFSSGRRKISIANFNKNGIKLDIQKLNLGNIDSLIDSEYFSFGGLVNLNGTVDDVFDIKSVNADLRIDSLRVSDIEYGTLQLSAQDDGKGAQTAIDLDINYPENNQRFQATGTLFPQNTEEFYDLSVLSKEMPLAMLEYLLYKSISNTKGTISGYFTVDGALAAPGVTGEARITDGQTKLDILGVTYFIPDARVEISPSYIDFSDQKIYDTYDNQALVQGKLTHDHFQDFGLDLNVTSDRFLFMNTSRADNPFYYGHVIGSADVDFSGSFERPNIDITAKNADNTDFTLNVASTEDVGDINFVTFTDFEDTLSIEKTETSEFVGPTGLNLSMNIEATEEGKMSIILDETTDSNIHGEGNGNLQLNLNRSGELELFGRYNITEGTYTFSSLQFVKKQFSVTQGSYVRFIGNPMDAIININAEYSTNASPKNLISRYLTSLEAEEISSTKVVVEIHLEGSLFQPDLSFDIEIPQVQGQIRSYVDNAIAALEADQSEMDFQALSLVSFGTFFPGETNNVAVSLGINTVSEFISSQVSAALSSLTNEAVSGVDFINQFDVNVNYNVDSDAIFEGAQAFGNQNEFQVGGKFALFENKVILEGGINYVENDIFNAGSYLGGNLSAQYVLTEDRRLRLRTYGLQDQVFEGSRVKGGVGLRYTSEFENFNVLWNQIFGKEEESDNESEEE